MSEAGSRTADLQMHTVASDGTDTIAERVADANRLGFDAIAITDHDIISDELSGRVTVQDGIEVITGAEIKCEVDGTGIEVLGYFLDPQDSDLQAVLGEVRGKRRDRMEMFVENINAEYDTDLSLTEVAAYADDTLGRPHLGQALIDRGLVADLDEAFATYIGKDSPAYVSTPKIPAERVIDAIHDNGGYASLSHPGRSLPRDRADDLIAELAASGLDALEVEYTYADKQARDSFTIHFDEAYAADLADRYNLGRTGGSDCHGQRSDKYYLGEVQIPYTRVEAIKDSIGL